MPGTLPSHWPKPASPAGCSQPLGLTCTLQTEGAQRCWGEGSSQKRTNIQGLQRAVLAGLLSAAWQLGRQPGLHGVCAPILPGPPRLEAGPRLLERLRLPRC